MGLAGRAGFQFYTGPDRSRSLRLGVGDLGFAGNKFVPSLTQFLFEFIIINLSLMLFNLLPIAPLDGEKIAIEVFPPAISRVMERISPYGSLILIAVILWLLCKY